MTDEAKEPEPRRLSLPFPHDFTITFMGPGHRQVQELNLVHPGHSWRPERIMARLAASTVACLISLHLLGTRPRT